MIARCSGADCVDGFQGEKLEVILFIKPRAFEDFERQFRPACERERVERQLHVRVLFLSGLGLVIEDVEVAISDLEEVNVAGDRIRFEREVEASAA